MSIANVNSSTVTIAVHREVVSSILIRGGQLFALQKLELLKERGRYKFLGGGMITDVGGECLAQDTSWGTTKI